MGIGAWSRRAALLGGGAALGVWGAGRFRASLPTRDGTASLRPDGAAGTLPETLNDASRLSQTPVFRHITLSEDVGEVLVARLRGELDEARATGRPVCLSAARWSMGGQSIPRDGHAITCDNGFVEPDTADGVFRVHAGARWSQVVAALDPLGFSPAVAPGYADFGVGAGLCVNCFGRSGADGPMGSAVRAFRMVMADGGWITCSREENPDLFAMTMGGYGLSGLITDLTVDMVANRRLEPEFQKMPPEDLGPALVAAAADPAVAMAEGRMNVARAAFLTEAQLVTWRTVGDRGDVPETVADTPDWPRRAQPGREAAKRARWWADTTLAPWADRATTRNSLLLDPAVGGRDPGRTAILHTYFVPPDGFAAFVAACRAIVPASYQEAVDVTLRHVAGACESWLCYSPGPRISVTLTFSQEMTARAEADMARITRALIDAALGLGGSYHLPFRPHATKDQFARAYPRAAAFAAAKRGIDPDLRFRNALWDGYLAGL